MKKSNEQELTPELILQWRVSCAASSSHFAWKQAKQERRNQGHEELEPTNEELTPGFIPVHSWGASSAKADGINSSWFLKASRLNGGWR
jgi:hypothetical protein